MSIELKYSVKSRLFEFVNPVQSYKRNLVLTRVFQSVYYSFWLDIVIITARICSYYTLYFLITTCSDAL